MTFTFTQEMHDAQIQREKDLTKMAREARENSIKRHVDTHQEYNLKYGQDALTVLLSTIEAYVKGQAKKNNMHRQAFYWENIRPRQQEKPVTINKTISEVVAVKLVSTLSGELGLQNTAGMIVKDLMHILDIEFSKREEMKCSAINYIIDILWVVAEDTDIYTIDQVEGREYRLFLSDTWKNKVEEAKENMPKSASAYAPMTVPPVPHFDLISPKGGYLSSVSPLLKEPTKDKDGNILDIIKEVNADTHPKLFAFYNKVQSTPYCVNKKGLEVISELYQAGLYFEDFPYEYDSNKAQLIANEIIDQRNAARMKYATNKGLEYTPLLPSTERKQLNEVEREMIQKVNKTHSLLKQAEEMSAYEALYYPLFVDSRGRMYPYATKGLTYQGDQMAKGLLQFANKQPLTPAGLDAMFETLANAIANKKSLATDYERMTCEKKRPAAEAFFAEHLKDFQRGDYSLFVIKQNEMNEPINAMMICIELVAFMEDPEGYRCGYIAHRDARVSGTSIIGTSANDKATMEKTSVLPWATEGGYLADSYTEAAEYAKMLCEEMAEKGNKLAQDLMTFKDKLFIRKAFKDQLMCKNAYGMTDFTVRSKNANIEGISWDDVLTWKHKHLFDDLMFTSLRHSSPASIRYLAVAEEIAEEVVERDGIISFKSPVNGFPFSIKINKEKTRRISIERKFGTIKLNIVTRLGDVDKKGVKSATAPSLIHHLDSAILYMVGSMNEGDICCIHDSMATNINNTKGLVSSYAKAMYVINATDPINKMFELMGTEKRVENTNTLPKEEAKNILKADHCIC